MTRGTKKSKGPICALCSATLVASPYATLFLHTESAQCKVVITDALGVCVDDVYYIADDGQIYQHEVPVVGTPAPVEFGGGIFIDGIAVNVPDGAGYLSVDSATQKLFASIEQPYLGGSSGSRGWSSISTFQRCRYLWKNQYGSGRSAINPDTPGPDALEIGSLVHLFLAIHYSQRINPLYPIDPEQAKRFLALAPVTPATLETAWQLFDAYRVYWGDEEWMKPLAVEELAVDPRTGFSCRWDLIFEVVKPYENMLPGVYVCNHKTGSANSQVMREQWMNDGQVLGEIDLYQRLGFHKRFGALRGNCINLIIKTKVPQFLRSIVLPQKRVLTDHHKSLKIWDAEMRVAEATGSFPRSRAACITKYQGFCPLFQHCAGGDDDAPREIDP